MALRLWQDGTPVLKFLKITSVFKENGKGFRCAVLRWRTQVSYGDRHALRLSEPLQRFYRLYTEQTVTLRGPEDRAGRRRARVRGMYRLWRFLRLFCSGP